MSTNLFSGSEVALWPGRRERASELHAVLVEASEDLVVLGQWNGHAVGMTEPGLYLSARPAARDPAPSRTPADRRVGEVVVEELSPLHHHDRVVLRREVGVLGELSAHEPRRREVYSVVTASSGGVDA